MLDSDGPLHSAEILLTYWGKTSLFMHFPVPVGLRSGNLLFNWSERLHHTALCNLDALEDNGDVTYSFACLVFTLFL